MKKIWDVTNFPESGGEMQSPPSFSESPNAGSRGKACYASHTTVAGYKVDLVGVSLGNPKAVIGYVSGLKSSPRMVMEELARFRGHNIAVIAISLPDAERRTDFIDPSREVVREFFFGEQSPLHKRYPKNIPRFAFTHSTASALYQDALLETDGDDHSKIHSAYHLNAFFDTAKSSSRFHAVGSFLLDVFGMVRGNALAGTSSIEKLITGDVEETTDFFEPPTHSQIATLREYCRNLGNKLITARHIIAHAMPQTYIVSEGDSRSCNKTVEFFARKTGGIVLDPIAGGHNSMKEAVDHVLNLTAPDIDKHLLRHKFGFRNNPYEELYAPLPQSFS